MQKLHNELPNTTTDKNFATPAQAADPANSVANGVASAAQIPLANLSQFPLRLNRENAFHYKLGELYQLFKEKQKSNPDQMNLIMERVDQVVGSLKAVKKLSNETLEYEWHILNELTEHSTVKKQNILDRLQLVAKGLQKRHPDLRMDQKNLMTGVVIDNQLVPVLKTSLLARSKVFEARSRFGEGQFLNLDNEEVGPATKEAFLTFIQSGHVDLSATDPVELLMLADKHMVKELQEAVLDLIKNNISDDNVLDLLKASSFLSNKKLAALCMLYLFNSKTTLPSEDPELSTLLRSLKKLKKEGGRLTYDKSTKMVNIRFKDWSTDHSEVLNTLCKQGELRLKLENNVHDDMSLGKLLQNAPHLHHLIIRNATLTTISGADNLKTLDCSFCEALTSLVAPMVTELDCAESPLLSSLYAPRATTIDCCFCKALTSLVAPMVTELYCIGCPLLSSLITPMATWLDCSDCPLLSSLIAPMATTLYCNGCTALANEKIAVAKGCKITR